MNSSSAAVDQHSLLRRALVRLAVVVIILVAMAGVISPLAHDAEDLAFEAELVENLEQLRAALRWHLETRGTPLDVRSWDELQQQIDAELHAAGTAAPASLRDGMPRSMPAPLLSARHGFESASIIPSPEQLTAAPPGLAYVQSTGAIVVTARGDSPSGNAWRDL